MIIQNAKVKVLSAPRSGISRTGNSYTVADLILGWNEESLDTSGNPVTVENSVQITLGSNWVAYVQQMGLKVGDTVNADIHFVCRSTRNFYNNDVNIVGLEKEQTQASH